MGAGSHRFFIMRRELESCGKVKKGRLTSWALCKHVFSSIGQLIEKDTSTEVGIEVTKIRYVTTRTRSNGSTGRKSIHVKTRSYQRSIFLDWVVAGGGQNPSELEVRFSFFRLRESGLER